MAKTRLRGIDAVRTAAIAFVVVLHAISISGILDYREAPLWSAFLYLRHLSLSCVPLFLMLTGYLQNRKVFCVAYYRGMIPLYLSYLLISALGIAATVWSGYGSGNSEVDLGGAVYSILNFSANGYAWYFEMYIGLFLLIPFLNMIYHGIHTRTGKHLLLLSLVFLTLMPDTIAGFSPYYDGSGSTVALNIFPDFFKSLYPVTFYFLGCYIAEYKPRLSGAKKLLALCAPLLPSILVALYTHLRDWYAWYLCNGFQTLTVGFTALLVFLALYDLDIKAKLIQKSLEQIALCTFEMYLFSYLWDNLLYHVLDLDRQLPFFAVAVLVFAGSFASAFVLRICIKPIGGMAVRGYDKLFGGKVENL